MKIKFGMNTTKYIPLGVMDSWLLKQLYTKQEKFTFKVR